jgi:hypothetical protein
VLYEVLVLGNLAFAMVGSFSASTWHVRFTVRLSSKFWGLHLCFSFGVNG